MPIVTADKVVLVTPPSPTQDSATIQALPRAPDGYQPASAAGLGDNGDFYFRTDLAVGSQIYQKQGGAWGAIA